MNYFDSKTISFILLFTLIILLAPSCKKDDTPPPDPELYDTYISHKLVKSYTLSEIEAMYETMELFYPEVADLKDLVKHGVEVYYVTYKTPFQGNEIEASGLVCVPSEEGTFSMISFQNGTNTSHDQAPSQDLSNYFFKALHGSASMGFIVLIPDYIGFGASNALTHPYLHKESTVKSIENLVTATNEMMTNELIKTKWNSDLYLMGYSQGGWSTMCAHNDISHINELGFNLKASACGAGPYKLSVVQDFMFQNITYPQPVYMAYTSVSYQELGLISNPLTDYFNEPYATELPSYFNGQFTNEEINDKLNDTVAVLISEEFLNGIDTSPKYQEFRDAMSDNSIHGWPTTQPIRIYHGDADTFVPDSTSKLIYQEFIDKGAGQMVNFISYEGLDHGTAAIPMIIDALLWFSDMEFKSATTFSKGSKPYVKIDASMQQLTIENMSTKMRN